MYENRRFFENILLFLTETHMFMRSACRVRRILSNEASFVEITRVFKELSNIIPKMSFSVGEMHINRRFFESKSLFLTQTHMFLCSAGRVQRFQSNEASFEGIKGVFKELSTTLLKISCSVGEMYENRSIFESESLFLTEAQKFLRIACSVQRIPLNKASLGWITRVFQEASSIIPKISWSDGEMHENRCFFERESLFLTETH